MLVLIPAAGSSSRMRGGDKLLEPVGGIPLLRRQAMWRSALSWQLAVQLPLFVIALLKLVGIEGKPFSISRTAEHLLVDGIDPLFCGGCAKAGSSLRRVAEGINYAAGIATGLLKLGCPVRQRARR